MFYCNLNLFADSVFDHVLEDDPKQVHVVSIVAETVLVENWVVIAQHPYYSCIINLSERNKIEINILRLIFYNNK